MKMPIAKVSPELAEGQPKNIAADPIELARELANSLQKLLRNGTIREPPLGTSATSSEIVGF
jgi:hypothetical protein